MFCLGYLIIVKSPETTGQIFLTTLRSYFSIVHRKNVSLV